MSAAAVEPHAWMRRIQRSSVDLPRSYSRITSARGLPESTSATICLLNSSVNCLGCFGSRMGPPFLEGPSDSHQTVQISIAISLFSDTPRGAEASAAIYSIVVTAKLNGLNVRSYVEWLLTEMPDDESLGEPGRVDRYLPWSGEVPDGCRLRPEKAREAAEMPDEPIVDAAVIEAARGLLQESSQGRPGGL